MSEEPASITEAIFIYLLDEGTDVWRPTLGRRKGPATFEVLPTPNYDPTDEHWQFVPGTIVRCEARRFREGAGLAAVEAVSAVSARNT